VRHPARHRDDESGDARARQGQNGLTCGAHFALVSSMQQL
jgi:hypothetical protein